MEDETRGRCDTTLSAEHGGVVSAVSHNDAVLFAARSRLVVKVTPVRGNLPPERAKR